MKGQEDLLGYFLSAEMSVEDANFIAACKYAGASWRGTAYLMAIVFNYDCGNYVEETGVIDTIWKVAERKSDNIWRQYKFDTRWLYEMWSPVFLRNALSIAKQLNHQQAERGLIKECQDHVSKLTDKFAAAKKELDLAREGLVEK